MTRLFPSLPGLLLLAFLAGCEAGPSAFDRSGQGPEDTADVSTLPALPQPSEAEAGSSGSGEGETDPADPDDPAGGVAAADRPEGETTTPASRGGVDTPPASSPASASAPTGERLTFTRPEHVRGLYLNAWASGSTRRVEALLEVARTTEINTFVIDIKDASGYVSHRTSVPMAQEIGATGEIRIRDLPGLLRKLHDAGVYPIARIVIVKDPLLAAAHPEYAVQDTSGGVFKDSKGIVWMNPYDRRVWDYHLDLAREVVGMGFPEVQWDYVRFPDIPASDKGRVVYPGAGDTPQRDAIREFLAYSRDQLGELGVTVTADVFGVTTSAARDVGIGQVWESFIDAVDVALPMVYPSHYWQGSFGFQTPNAYPYEIVKRALEDALRRSEAVEGAGTTRPWLQDFSLGKPPYGAPEVRAQIQATYDVGIHEWILWNPGSRYTHEALEPAGGFVTEPLIRIGGRVVPVSRRVAVLDSVAAAKNAQSPQAQPKPAPAAAPPDTAGVG